MGCLLEFKFKWKKPLDKGSAWLDFSARHRSSSSFPSPPSFSFSPLYTMHPSRGLARLSKQASKAKAAQKAFMATVPRMARPSVVAPVMAGRQQTAPAQSGQYLHPLFFSHFYPSQSLFMHLEEVCSTGSDGG